jgi:hypothetical protein
MTHQKPFLLDGGRAGMEVNVASAQTVTLKAIAYAASHASFGSDIARTSIPNPSPIEGEGRVIL